MTITLHARPRNQSRETLTKTRCPLCRDELRAGACGHCPECETRYHRDCYSEFGGCSTLGCSAYRQPPRGSRPRHRNETCAACWDGEESGALAACSGCEARLHPHCLDQEGCGTRGCDNQRAPRRTPRRGSRATRPGPRRRSLHLRAKRPGATSQVLSVCGYALAGVALLILSLSTGSPKALLMVAALAVSAWSDD